MLLGNLRSMHHIIGLFDPSNTDIFLRIVFLGMVERSIFLTEKQHVVIRSLHRSQSARLYVKREKRERLAHICLDLLPG